MTVPGGSSALRAADQAARAALAEERAHRWEAEADRINDRYLRLQEAVVEETRCLPDVRTRILRVCQ